MAAVTPTTEILLNARSAANKKKSMQVKKQCEKRQLHRQKDKKKAELPFQVWFVDKFAEFTFFGDYDCNVTVKPLWLDF